MSKQTDGEIKRLAIINSSTEQVRSLLETHFSSIVKAAEDSFVDDDNLTEPRAKVAIAIEFDVMAMAPKVGVKIGWSVRFKDESEAEIDPLQTKLGLPEDSK